MFENWAADVLANYLGKFVGVQRDRLKISLWGGEGILENVQLRVDAFDYLQLPFVVKEGSIGRLKLQIPWGRWRGGALVVELSDVVLCISSRAETDWEEGPALRRAQAAKQAQLAAAELAKLGSRVAATGRASTTTQQADYAAATAAGAAASAAGAGTAAGPGLGSSWGWAVVDYVTSFLLNRLHFEVKNVHAYFEAPAVNASEYEAFGVQLGSLTTVVPGKVPDLLAAFAGLKPVEPGLAAKVVRQLHVQGWSGYWKPRQQQMQPQQLGQNAAAGSSARQAVRQPTVAAGRARFSASAAPVLDPTNYILAPVEAVLEIAVHNSSSSAAGGSVTSSTSPGVACDVFIGAPEVSMQLSSQQLAGMGRLADDAAVWVKRNKYGRYRPPGWITMMQALRQRSSGSNRWGSQVSGAFTRASSWQRTELQALHQQQHESAGASQQGAQQQRASSNSGTGGYKQYLVTPTGRCGVGAPVTWLQVWHYAVRATVADLRDNRRKQRDRTLRKSEVMARRRYVHLYQHKLEFLQQTPSSTALTQPAAVPVAQSANPANADGAPAAAAATVDTTISASKSRGTSNAGKPPARASDAAWSAASKAEGVASALTAADVAGELARLEQELDVEDILLCRSLAEVALDRRTADSSESERYRSWFAWGTSGIANFLYPSSTAAVAAGSSKPFSSKGGSSSGGTSSTSMPTEADLDELLALLHGVDADGVSAGVSAATATAAAVAAGTAGVEAATAGTAAATAITAKSSTPEPSRHGGAPAVSLNWHLLSLHAVLQDCTQPKQRKELVVLDIQGTSIQASSRSHRLAAQLQVQDLQLYDCCSDPGVRECVLQRLDPYSPAVVASGVQTLGGPYGTNMVGSGFQQGSTAQHQNPEVYGWADISIPAVSSRRSMGSSSARSYAAAITGSSSTTAKHRAAQPPLLSVSFTARGPHNHLVVWLEPLQFLARPGCIVGLRSMLQHLPTDTVQQQRQAAAAEIHAVQEAAGLQPAGSSQQKPVQLPPQLVHLQLNLLLQEMLVLVPTSLDYTSGLNAVVHLRALELSPAAAAAAGPDGAGARVDSAGVQEYQVDTGSDALSEDDASSAADSTTSSGHSSDVGTDNSSEGSSGTSSPSTISGVSFAVGHQTALAAAADAPVGSQPVQQQYALGLAMLTVGLQQPVGAHQGCSSQQQRTLELLTLPAVQGSLVLTFAAASAAAARPGAVASAAAVTADVSSTSPSSWPQQLQHHDQQGPVHLSEQVPLLRLTLQLPPLSSTITATLIRALQLFSQVLKSQLQMPLAEFAECYKLNLSQQQEAIAQKQLQRQQQQAQAPTVLPDTSAFVAGVAEAAAAAEIAVEPPSPTDSEVERWMVAPATMCRADADGAQASEQGSSSGAASSSSTSGLPGEQPQQLKRCDSDGLLQSMSPPGMGILEQASEQQQPQPAIAGQQQQQPRGPRITAPAAAAVLALPVVQLFEFDLLIQELNAQYIHDVTAVDPTAQPQQPQHVTPNYPQMHLQLQASTLLVLFRHSTHGSKADVSVSNLQLQDMLPAPAAIAASGLAGPGESYTSPVSDFGAPDIRRLLKHITLEHVQVAWQQQLGPSAVLQETLVSVTGLQAQGHPGDVGLFLLPAHQDAPISLAVRISSSTPYRQPATVSAASAATQISVQLDNAALGLDGVLKIVAAAEAAQGHKSGQTSVDQRQPQCAAQTQPENQRAGLKPSLAVHVQVSQCQVLSCRGAGASSDSNMPAGRMNTDWRPWDIPLQDLQRRTSVAAGVSSQQQQRQQDQQSLPRQVVCDLLLNLPMIAVDIAPAALAGAAPRAHPKSPPMVLVEDVGLYIPDSCGSDTLLPVLSIPYVAFRQHLQQQERHVGRGLALAQQHSPAQRQSKMLLAQSLHIPAVGASLRPSHVQHSMQLVHRQQQQWQQWTATVPKRAKHQKPDQHQHHQQQEKADTNFFAEVDDLQLLLLAAPGTSDKALLLQWQQLQVKLQQSQPNASQQQQQQQTPADAHKSAATPPMDVPLDAKVSWAELSVSAVQQNGQDVTSQSEAGQAAGPTVTTVYQPESPARPINPRATESEQSTLTDLKLQASLLPAVSWLASGASSSWQLSQQQHKQLPRQGQEGAVTGTTMTGSAFAVAAAAPAGSAAAAAGAPESPAAVVPINSRPGSVLQTHAMLSRFLSAKESWRSVDLGSSVASASEAFFSPRSSGAWLSAASSVGNSSTSSTIWASAVGSSHLSVSGRDHASQTAGGHPVGTAAISAPLASQDSIIAASWHMDIPGTSPGSAGLWGTSPGARGPGVSGLFRSDAQAAAAAAGVGVADSSVPHMEQQLGSAEGGQAGTAPSQLPSSSPSMPVLSRINLGLPIGSSPRYSSSFSHRRDSSPSVHHSRSFAAAHSPLLVSNSNMGIGVGVRDSMARQGLPSSGTMGQDLGPRLSPHWLDIDDEFYSVAGESSLADDRSVSEAESPAYSPAAQAGPFATHDAVVECQFLPMAGFGVHGCDTSTRWLLLSLTAGLSGTAGDTGDAALASTGACSAVQLTVTEGMSEQGTLPSVQLADRAPSVAAADIVSSTLLSLPQQQQVCRAKQINVLLLGWQLQINSKCWDMVAPSIMQAVNAAAASAPAGKTTSTHQGMMVYSPSASTMLHNRPATDGQPVSSNISVSTTVQVSVKQLQLMLFIPPNEAPAAVHRQQQQPAMKHVLSRDFGPWQDPGSTTSPTAAAPAGVANTKSTPFSTPFSSPAKEPAVGESLSPQPAAQVVVVSMGASAVLTDGDGGQHGRQQPKLRLQEGSVPELSVSVGAVALDAATVRPAAGVSSTQQQEFLLLVLLKQLRLSAVHGPLPMQRQQLECQALHSTEASSAGPLQVTRLLDDTITATSAAVPTAAAVHDAAIAAGPSTRAATMQAYDLDVNSISGWVSTVRLSLLMNLQQVLLQQLPAITTAAAMAGPASYRLSGQDTVAHQAPPITVGPSYNHSSRAVLGGGATSSSKAGTATAAAGVSCKLTAHKVAILVSSDEPEPWLLQHNSTTTMHLSPSSSQADTDQRPPFTTCTTPLLEVALLPLTVHVQSTGERRSRGPLLEVHVSGSPQADVFNVDKLGWEPMLDPWHLQASLQLVPSSSALGHTSKQSLRAAVTATNLLDLTVAPSSIVALQQLQVLAADAAAWHLDIDRLQQLLQCLSNPDAAAAFVSGGRSCWLVNHTGTPLNYTVADAAAAPAAAASLVLTSELSGLSQALSGALPFGTRGRAAHQVPVPLRVLDRAATGYYGRYVEGPGSAAAGAPAAGSVSTTAAGAVKRPQVLFVQAPGQASVVGPIALGQLGCSLHSVSLPVPGGVSSMGSWTSGGTARRPRQQQLVAEVSRHRYGGHLVSLHSTVELVNKSSVQLDLGYCSPPRSGGDSSPVVLGVIGPGSSLWLPLQVLQSSWPSLCLRPTGIPTNYAWCKALDVLSMLPTASGAASMQPSSITAPTDDTGFWYYPSKLKPASRYISFQQSIQSEKQEQQQSASAAVAAMQSDNNPSSGTTSADAPMGAGQVLLAVGCCAKPPPTAAETSSMPGLWQVVIEAPAVFINQLPVPCEVSVTAVEGFKKGLQAVVGSRESLPIYGCQAQQLSHIRVRPEGFRSSPWIALDTGLRAAADSAATPRVAAGEAAHEQQNVAVEMQVAGIRSDQPPQMLQLRTSRNSRTGSLTVRVACSLWLFNCLGFQVAVKQPDAGSAADGSTSGPASPVYRWTTAKAATVSTSTDATAAASAAGSNPALWLKPYPWLPGLPGSSSTLDLAGAAQQSTSPTAAGAAASSSASTAALVLARSASTPALSSLGLGAITSPPQPLGASAGLADLSRSSTAAQQLQQGMPFTPARVGFDPALAALLSPPGHRHGLPRLTRLGATDGQKIPGAEQHQQLEQRLNSMRRSLSSSCLGQQQPHQPQPEPQQNGWPFGIGLTGLDTPVDQHSVPEAVSATVADAQSHAVQHQHAGDPAAAAAAGSQSRRSRQRRHSSGLFMLASGQLPSMLPSELEEGQPPGTMARQASAIFVPSVGTTAGPIVYRLGNPDSPGTFLPLLAAGDLASASHAAESVVSPEAPRPAAAAESPGTRRRQRSSAAAAAVDALLAEMASHHQQQQQQQRHSAPAGDEQTPTMPPTRSSATAADTSSMSGSMGSPERAALSTAVGLVSLAHSARAGQSAVTTPFAAVAAADQSAGLLGLTVPRSSVPGQQAAARAAPGVSAPAAAATASGASGSSIAARSQAGGSVRSSVAAVPAVPAAAVPVMCGWRCQAVTSSNSGRSKGAVAQGQSSSSVQLQLCVAPAAPAAAVAGRGLQQVPSSWSAPAAVELRQGGSGPANILKLPLALPTATVAHARSSPGGLETVAVAPSDGARPMHTSISSGTLGSLDSPRSSTAAANQQHSRRKSGWRRSGQTNAAASQQGVCFVSVHTAPVPGGGGAWAVHLLPTYLLVNTLQCEVQLRQYGSGMVLQTVSPGGHCCVLWPDALLPLKLQFRVAEPGWSWSGAAAVESPGEFLVKVRHRNRGETLLLQVDVAAASSGSSMVATLSAREGGFAPYRIENCSDEVIHVQQVGCVEQEDVLQPYSSLPFAWDEPSLPHKVLLFLPGRRLLGEFPLEQVGQSRRIAISGVRRRTLLLTTYPEGPMRVLRVLDTSMHLAPQPGAVLSTNGRSRLHTAAASSSASRVHAGTTGGLSSYGSQASLGQLSRTSGTAQLLHLSRSSSSASFASATQQGAAHQQQQQKGPSSASYGSSSVQGGIVRPFGDKQNLLRRLGAFLGLPMQQQQQQLGLPSCDSTAVSIQSPSIDLQIQLAGLGVSLVSDSRELLYMCASSLSARVCQDPVRTALGFCISSIRVENTLYGCQYPLLLVSPVSRSVFGIVVPQAAVTGAGPNSGSSSSSTVGALVTAGPDQHEVAASAPIPAAAAAEDSQTPTALESSITSASSPFQHSSGADQQAGTARLVSGSLAAVIPQQQQQQQQQQRVVLPHHLALGILATVWRSQPSGVICIEQLGVHVSPLALSLEGKHIKQLVDFFTGLAAAAATGGSQPVSSTYKSRRAQLQQQQQQQQLAPVQPPGVPASAVQRSHVKLYMEDIRLSDITLCVSFAPDSWFDPLPGIASGVTRSPGSAVAADLSRVGPVVTPQDLSPEVPDATFGTSGAPAAAAASGTSSAAAAAAASSDTQAELAEAEAGAAAAAAAAGELYSGRAVGGSSSSSSSAAQQLPIWLQMALALAHAEEGAWLTLAPFESSHTCINTDSLGQVLGRHYILAAYRELPKVLASLDIFGDPARLLQALGLGFWHLLTLPAHSARWGPYRSLQRLVRGVRVMAYGISSSVAKGSKRSKAALLPLVPAGLTWQQQQPGAQQQGGGAADRDHRAAVSSLVLISDGESVLTGGSSFTGAAAAGNSSSSSGSIPGAGGQDLLHVLVAGYSLTFQQMLRSFQAGQPLKGLATAAAQALVLPALLLLEITESTATSFRRLLIEQVAGAVPVRVPRHVAAGQLLRPYDRLESLGRALLHRTSGSFVTEGFLGCVELHLGLYAVVTAGHLLIISCSITTPAAVRGSSGSSAAGSSLAQQQQQSVHVQYKHPELLLVLSVKDVMMVAVEGSAVRLLCMAGDQAAASLSPAIIGPSNGNNTSEVKGALRNAGAGLDVAAQQLEGRAPTVVPAPAAAAGVDPGEVRAEINSSGLRELVASSADEQLPQHQPQQHLEAHQHAAAAEAPASPVSAGRATPPGTHLQAAGTGLAGSLGVLSTRVSVPAAVAPGAVDLTAAVAAVDAADAAVAAANSSPGGPGQLGFGAQGFGAEAFVGGKWFEGHAIACDSENAARQLQQLLQKACSRLDTLIASSVWQRQLML